MRAGQTRRLPAPRPPLGPHRSRPAGRAYGSGGSRNRARPQRTREGRLTLRAPIAFTYGNCVFASGCADPWAVFALDVCSYQWLSVEAKQQRLLALLGAVEATQADVQILRVGRPWDIATYAQGVRAGVAGDADGACGGALGRYVDEQVRRLREIAPVVADVFVCVSLRKPARDVASFVSRAAEERPREWLRGLRRAFALGDSRMLAAGELERVRARADQVHARLTDYLGARPARSVELQWLVRRSF